jgi:two-component system chemotaxis response regulator CheB
MSAAKKQDFCSVGEGVCVFFSVAAGRAGSELSSLAVAGLSAEAVAELIAVHRARHNSDALTWKVLGVGAGPALAARYLSSLHQKVEKQVARETAFDLVHLKAEGRLRISVPAETSAPAPAVPAGREKDGPAAERRRLKVLVVDDSTSIRNLLKKMVEEESDLEVVATAERPSEVEALIQQYRPDVITLDIHMPEEDGVSLLKRLFPKYRVPTIMVTAISLQEGRKVFEALESGAVDYVQKPDFKEIRAMGSILREKIRMASQAKVVNHQPTVAAAPRVSANARMDPNSIIVIGSSTGGTEALKVLLTGLPAAIPPILIVQHIPPVFSKAFADRMNQLCPFEVLEGNEAGMEIRPGRVIVAAGGTQMGVRKVGPGYRITVDPAADPVNRHKPSVDYLFDSIKDQYSGKRVGVILTGMGADGAKGMKSLKERGWRTIAQDEASSVVFGMPKEAIRLGGVDDTLALPRIAARLVALLEV